MNWNVRYWIFLVISHIHGSFEHDLSADTLGSNYKGGDPLLPVPEILEGHVLSGLAASLRCPPKWLGFGCLLVHSKTGVGVGPLPWHGQILKADLRMMKHHIRTRWINIPKNVQFLFQFSKDQCLLSLFFERSDASMLPVQRHLPIGGHVHGWQVCEVCGLWERMYSIVCTVQYDLFVSKPYFSQRTSEHHGISWHQSVNNLVCINLYYVVLHTIWK